MFWLLAAYAHLAGQMAFLQEFSGFGMGEPGHLAGDLLFGMKIQLDEELHEE